MRGVGVSEEALERELLKYLPTLPFRPYNEDNVAASSQDTSLTALAQLGCLRLRASRCFISLFDKTQQYILAEATPTLSLQSDLVHDAGDELWFGTAILHRHASPCSVLLEQWVKACSEGTEDADVVTVISDLTLQDALKDTLVASKTPKPHFYASVPLRSPRGAIIGSYCVLDDKPRSYTDPTHLQFLIDMANTTMKHLVMMRVMEEYRQGERMIRGIGSFVEGKATLRDWRATTGYEARSYEPSRTQYGGEGQLDKHQQLLQKQESAGAVFQDTRPDAHGGHEADERRFSEHPALKRSYSDWSPSSASTSTAAGQDANPFEQSFSSRSASPITTPTGGIGTSQSPGSPPLHESDMPLSHSIPLAFSRAANIIRECLEVEGAVFYDASINSHGGLVREIQENTSSTETSSNEEARSSNSTDSDASRNAKAFQNSPIIAFSDSQLSSINNETSSAEFSRFPEKFLRSLLRRYPHGKIFHFDTSGNLSSGSSGDESLTDPIAVLDRRPPMIRKESRKKIKRKSIRPQEGVLLSKIFPGARSIGLFSLWDGTRERWHAGGFIWTKQPNRSFTVEGQLSFLNAIGSSIMAEVARLNALKSDRAKSDLLGSISHELRSPLHGILGSVELLEGSPQTAFQADMIQSIDTCGKTLLDTIEQLLDFTKINHIAQRKKRMTPHSAGYSSLARSQLGDPATRLDVITEEVVTAVAAGFDAQRRAQSRVAGYGDGGDTVANQVHDIPFSSDRYGDSSQPWVNQEIPAVVLDIDKGVDTAFFTFPGAWRRIVMNLFANSLKYTKHGSIKISLSAKPTSKKPDNALWKIYLTVSDSGQGMSAEYLRDRLFKPFAQEDSLASGAGLGLSIVKQIVDSYNGKISVESTQNVGTKISVSMYLERAHSPDQDSQDDEVVRQIRAVSQQTQGKIACLLNPRETKPDSLETSTSTSSKHLSDDDNDKVGSAMRKLCQGWFGLTFCAEPDLENQECDIFLLVEPEFHQPALDVEKIHSLGLQRGKSGRKPVLLFICRSPGSTQKVMLASQKRLSDAWIVQYISQPCGAHKLAKFLSMGLEQQATGVAVRPQLQAVQRYSSDRLSTTTSSSSSTRTLKTQQSSSGPSTDKDYISVSSSMQTTVSSDSSLENSKNDVKSAVTEEDTPSSATEPIPSPPTRDLVSSPSKPPSASSSFLLVDDNPINLKILTSHMKRRNTPYLTASNGVEALEIYTSNPAACEIILMDISMPVMDGLASTRAIRLLEKQKGLQPCIIIILTGLASASIQEETHASGADAYLAKPVRLKELDDILVRIKSQVRHEPQENIS